MSDEATPLNVPSTPIECIRKLERECKRLKVANAKLLAVKEAAEEVRRGGRRFGPRASWRKLDAAPRPVQATGGR
jgi:hypothetical protein